MCQTMLVYQTNKERQKGKHSTNILAYNVDYDHAWESPLWYILQTQCQYFPDLVEPSCVSCQSLTAVQLDC